MPAICIIGRALSREEARFPGAIVKDAGFVVVRLA